MDAPTSAWSTTSPPPAPNPPLPRSASVGGMRLDSLQRVKQHQDNGSAALNVSASSNSPNALDRFVQLFVQSSSPAASPERTRINASDLAPLDAHPALERRRTRSSSLHWTSRSSNDLHHYGDERNSVEEARKYSISSSTSSYGAPSTRYRRTVEGAGDIGESPQSRSTTTLSTTNSPASTLFTQSTRRRSNSAHQHLVGSSSLLRTYSNTSSAASSDYPATPAQTQGADPACWSPTSPGDAGGSSGVRASLSSRGAGPTMINPRFAAPMLRGSGSKQGGSQGTGLGLLGARTTPTVDNELRQGSFVASLGLAPLVDELGRPVPLRPATSLDLSRHTLSPTIVDPSTSSLSPRLQEAFSPTPPLSPELATSSNRPSNRQKSKKAHPRRRRSGTRAHRRSSSGSSSSASSTGLNAIRASPSAPELRHSPPRNHLHARTYSRAPHSSIPTPSASRTRQHHQKKVSLASHSHSTGTIYVEAPVSVCEAIVAPKPRLAPRSLHESPHVTEADGTAVFKATFDDEDQQEVLRRSIDASSMRRVLRENEESRKEREGWSDSGQSSSGFAGLRIELGRRRSGKSRNELGGLRPGDENRGSVYARRAERRREREAKDAARSKGALADASPDLPSSFDGFATPFDGFTGLVRKLSRSRERRPSGSSTPAEEHHGLGISRSLSTSPIKLRRRRSNAPPLPSSATFASLEGPAFVGDKPIRHLRSSASVDSLYTRPSASISARQTHYGEAVTNAHSASATPAPTLLSQNAVLSLPPHLHHLLRAPLAAAATSQDDAPLISPTFIPQRAPPPAPTFPRVEALSEEIRNDRRHARSSSESAAALVLALDRMFDEEDQLRAKEAQLFHDELTLGRGAPLAWRERGDVPVVFPAVTTPSPPPFPRPLPFSAPISRPSSTGFGHSLPPPPRPRRPRPSSRPTGESSNSDPASTTSSTRNPVSPLLQDLTDTLGPRRGSVEAGAALEGSPIGDSPGSHGTPTSVAGRSVLDLDEEDWTFDNLFFHPPTARRVRRSSSTSRRGGNSSASSFNSNAASQDYDAPPSSRLGPSPLPRLGDFTLPTSTLHPRHSTVSSHEADHQLQYSTLEQFPQTPRQRESGIWSSSDEEGEEQILSVGDGREEQEVNDGRQEQEVEPTEPAPTVTSGALPLPNNILPSGWGADAFSREYVARVTPSQQRDQHSSFLDFTTTTSDPILSSAPILLSGTPPEIRRSSDPSSFLELDDPLPRDDSATPLSFIEEWSPPGSPRVSLPLIMHAPVATRVTGSFLDSEE